MLLTSLASSFPLRNCKLSSMTILVMSVLFDPCSHEHFQVIVMASFKNLSDCYCLVLWVVDAGNISHYYFILFYFIYNDRVSLAASDIAVDFHMLWWQAWE